jgi:hypothetical protein
MSEKKIVAPEGMLKVFHHAENHHGNKWDDQVLDKMLEAALRWLSENPILPSELHIAEMCGNLHARGVGLSNASLYRELPIEWQRRMFLASGSEAPEAVQRADVRQLAGSNDGGFEMGERRIKVPDGMLKAVSENWPIRCMEDKAHVMATLEAALRWLSENPILPSPPQRINMSREFVTDKAWVLCEAWQRRMFIAPEPEVPEAVKDLLAPPGIHTNFTVPNDIHDVQIIEAYRRGQHSKENANG